MQEKEELKSFNEFDDDEKFEEGVNFMDEEPKVEIMPEEDYIEENPEETPEESPEEESEGIALEEESPQNENPLDEVLKSESPAAMFKQFKLPAEGKVEEPLKTEPDKPRVPSPELQFKTKIVDETRGRQQDEYYALTEYASILSKVIIRKKDLISNRWSYLSGGIEEVDFREAEIEDVINNLCNAVMTRWGAGVYSFIFSAPKQAGKKTPKVPIQLQIGEIDYKKIYADANASKQNPTLSESQNKTGGDTISAIQNMQNNTNETIMTLMKQMKEERREENLRFDKQLREEREKSNKIAEATRKSTVASEGNVMTTMLALMQNQLEQSQNSNRDNMELVLEVMKGNSGKQDPTSSFDQALKMLEVIKGNEQPQSGGISETLRTLRDLDNFRNNQPLSDEEPDIDDEEPIETPPVNPFNALIGTVGAKIGEGLGKVIIGNAPVTKEEIDTITHQSPAQAKTEAEAEIESVPPQESAEENVNYLKQIIDAITASKDAGVSNNEIATSYQELYEKVKTQYGEFIKGYTPESIVELGTKIDARLSGKYHNDFIEIFGKLMGK